MNCGGFCFWRCDFLRLGMKYIGNRRTYFAPNSLQRRHVWSLARRSLNVKIKRSKVKGQGHQGQKRGFRRISRKPLNGFAPNTQGRRSDKFEGQGQFLRPACGLCLEKHLLCSGFVFSECFVFLVIKSEKMRISTVDTS